MGRRVTADAESELHVLRRDGDALGVDSAEVRVLEQARQVRLGGLLHGQDRGTLEAEVCSIGLGNLANEPLKWQLAHQQRARALVLTDLAQSECAGAEASFGLGVLRIGGDQTRGLFARELCGRMSGPVSVSRFDTCHFEVVLWPSGR